MAKTPLKADFLPNNNRTQKTLWIFGAGASAHLGFPLSRGFFRCTVRLLTESLGEPDYAAAEIGNCLESATYKNQLGKPLTQNDIDEIKTDTTVAFDQIASWTATHQTDAKYGIRFQHLTKELGRLRCVLNNIGIELPTQELLDTEPENLIDRIRTADANKILSEQSNGRDVDKIRRDILEAQECVRRIYFYSLSEFNDQIREQARVNTVDSCYDQLIKSMLMDSDSRIISFNYDTVLDESLFENFTGTWAYERLHLAAINGHPVSSGPEGDLMLIKPHGSLNMFVCGNCGRTHIQWFARVVPRGPNTNALHNRRCTHCKVPLPGRKELLSEQVVSPLYDKESIDGSKGAIRRAFAWATQIISVGFSFPEQDAYFLECFETGLRANTNESIRLSLVLRSREGTTALKNRLDDNKFLREHVSTGKLKIEATAIAGFEHV